MGRIERREQWPGCAGKTDKVVWRAMSMVIGPGCVILTSP